jgi:hypothetical protein
MDRITELENESKHGRDSYNQYHMSYNVMSEGGNYEKIGTEVHDSVFDVGNKP